jgi:hypothetical protein
VLSFAICILALKAALSFISFVTADNGTMFAAVNQLNMGGPFFQPQSCGRPTGHGSVEVFVRVHLIPQWNNLSSL